MFPHASLAPALLSSGLGSPQYSFEGRTTCKFLDCMWGPHRARWQMARVSDQPASAQEVEQMLREIDRSNCRR